MQTLFSLFRVHSSVGFLSIRRNKTFPIVEVAALQYWEQNTSLQYFIREPSSNSSWTPKNLQNTAWETLNNERQQTLEYVQEAETKTEQLWSQNLEDYMKAETGIAN